jgi:peptidoglycan/LPS O-acetylase OafA/YrhL
VLATLCVAVLLWRCWLALQGVSDDYISMATDTRVDAILIGCLLALRRNPWLDPVGEPDVWRDWGLAGACIAVLVGTLAYRSDFFRQTARYTLQSLAIAPLLWLAVARAHQAPFRWLNARVLVYIGTISYTIYLSHHVIALGVTRNWPQLGLAGSILITGALTLAVAEAMRRWVEQPCALWRRRLHRTPARPVMAPGLTRTSSP